MRLGNTRWIGLTMGVSILSVSAPARSSDVAAPAPPTICGAANVPLGSAMVETANCLANAPTEPGYDLDDVYYSNRVSVTPGPGFATAGPRLDKSVGKVLENILGKLFGEKRGTSLSLVWYAKMGDQTYPIQPLITFTRGDDGTWQSHVTRVDETLLHRLGPNPYTEIHFTYLFSNQPDLDLSSARSLLGLAVPAVASDAAKPVFDKLQNLATVALRTGTLKLSSDTSDRLEPRAGQKVSMTIEIRDPAAKDASAAPVIATIKVELWGTRSLLHDTAVFSGIASTLPADHIADKLDDLVSFVTTGKASKWPSTYSVVASLGTASPIGTATSSAPEDVKKFCAAVTKQIKDDYSFSPVDSLLLRAGVVELVSSGIKAQVNPYRLCFNDDQRAIIHAKLDYDTDYILAVTPTAVSGFKDLQLLRTAAAWFTAKDCLQVAIDNSPFATYLSDTVTVTARENLPDGNKVRVMPLADRKAGRDDFLAATCGSFLYWNTLNSTTGQFRVSQTSTDPGWLVTGNLSGGKIADISITN